MSNISASTDVSMLPDNCQCHVVPGSGRHNPDPLHTVVGGDDATAAVVVVVVVGAAVTVVATGTVEFETDVDVVDARATGIDEGELEEVLAT
jgi:hypothetical protein